jgi:rRNA maturation endonuclease Nob1
MRHCISCALEYQYEKFCTSCGHELEQGRLPAAMEKEKSTDQCIACGRVFRVDERFCGSCGLPYGKATAGVFRFYVEEDSAEDDATL